MEGDFDCFFPYLFSELRRIFYYYSCCNLNAMDQNLRTLPDSPWPVDTRLGSVGLDQLHPHRTPPWDSAPSALMGPNSPSEKRLTFQQVRYRINNQISIVLALPARRSGPKPGRANGTADIDPSGPQNMLWFHQHFALVQTHAKPSLPGPRFLWKGEVRQ